MNNTIIESNRGDRSMTCYMCSIGREIKIYQSPTIQMRRRVDDAKGAVDEDWLRSSWPSVGESSCCRCSRIAEDPASWTVRFS